MAGELAEEEKWQNDWAAPKARWSSRVSEGVKVRAAREGRNACSISSTGRRGGAQER